MLFKHALRHPISTISTVFSDPIDVAFHLRERFADTVDQIAPVDYRPDQDWEARLASHLGLPDEHGFGALWAQVIASLGAKGLKVGPSSFYGWNDGDAGFVRAIWRIVRHIRPTRVVETGVGHGVTSRFILEALQRNGAGQLSSIDLRLFDPEKRGEVGAAVGDALRSNWNYIAGTSRYKLPKLLAKLNSVDLFIHDSSHTDRNMTFELETVWPFLRPGGVIVVDDIDINSAFRRFAARYPTHLSLICTAEPLRPDERRFNRKGLFGIICRNPEL